MKAAMRSLKNSVLNYTDEEVRVREATSNDSWGASSSLMNTIAEDTFHRYRYANVFQMIMKRLVDYNHLNHVLKTLILVEFLLRNADERFVHDMIDKKTVVRRLKGYKYFNGDKELGEPVRKWSAKVMTLLENEDELKRARETAKVTRAKIHGEVQSSGIDDAYAGAGFSEKPEFETSPRNARKISAREEPIDFDKEFDADADFDSPKAFKKKVDPEESDEAPASSKKKGKGKGKGKKLKEHDEEVEEKAQFVPDFGKDAFAEFDEEFEEKPKKVEKGKKEKKKKKDSEDEPATGQAAFDFDAEFDSPPVKKEAVHEKTGPASGGDDWLFAIAAPVKSAVTADSFFDSLDSMECIDFFLIVLAAPAKPAAAATKPATQPAAPAPVKSVVPVGDPFSGFGSAAISQGYSAAPGMMGGYPAGAWGAYPGAAPGMAYPGAAPGMGFPGAAPGMGFPGAPAPGMSFPPSGPTAPAKSSAPPSSQAQAFDFSWS